MNKKTIFYIVLSLVVVSFYLYLLGYRLDAKSIYKEHAQAYMSETYEVIVETDDYAIVEFEGVTELIPFKNSNRLNDTWTPSLYSFLKIEKYSNLSLTYPVQKMSLKNYYSTAYQIIKNDDYKLRVLSYTFYETEEYGTPFEEKIGYIYVDNNSNKPIDFMIWNVNDDTYTPLVYTIKTLDSGASLLYSEQVVKERSKLVPLIDGVVIDEYESQPTILNVSYKENKIDESLYPLVEDLDKIPSSFDPDMYDGTLDNITPILSIRESQIQSDDPLEVDTINFYEYQNKVYKEYSGAYYVVSKSLFYNLIDKLKPTQ